MRTIIVLLLIFFNQFFIHSQEISIASGFNLFESPCIFQDCDLIQSESYALLFYMPIKESNLEIGIKYRMYSKRGVEPWKSENGLLLHHYLDKSQNAFTYDEYEVGVSNRNNQAVFWGQNSKIFGAVLAYKKEWKSKFFIRFESGLNLELSHITYPDILSNDGLGTLITPEKEEIAVIGPISYNSFSETWVIGSVATYVGYYLTANIVTSIGIDFNYVLFEGAYMFFDISVGYKF